MNHGENVKNIYVFREVILRNDRRLNFVEFMILKPIEGPGSTN
jgi:hypothetical protein